VALDLAMLEFEKVIIHEIPRHPKAGSQQPVFSEIESDLNEEVCNLLRSKIIDTIKNKSYNIVFKSEIASPVPEIIQDLLLDDKHLIEKSKEIAIHLNNIQDSRNPGGYLTFLVGHVQDNKIVGILKIEKEEGGRIQQATKNGKLTFDILSLKDIILTKNTRFYKISVFINDGPKKYGYNGKVCDNQLTKKEEIANFFLNKFLGCEFVQDQKVRTKEFYDATEKFIKKHIVEPNDQVRYHFQLLAYLTSQLKEISSENFAKNYFDPENRKKYLDYLTKTGFHNELIKKDLSKIEKEVQFKVLSFEDGIDIKGTRKAFDEHVTYKEMDDGMVHAEVISRLKKY
jgi:nucleoid-associated protein YejK